MAIKLTEEEKQAIHDPRDYPIISLIKEMSPSELKELYHSIIFKDGFRKHYVEEEKLWIRDAAHYMRINSKKPTITDVEIADEILNNNLHEKFRIYYAAKYRSNVDISENSRLIRFLSQVDSEKPI